MADGAFWALLTGRTRSGGARFRRATIALALAIVVVVSMIAVFVGIFGIQGLALLSLIPLLVGTVLLTRPTTQDWYAAVGGEGYGNG